MIVNTFEPQLIAAPLLVLTKDAFKHDSRDLVCEVKKDGFRQPPKRGLSDTDKIFLRVKPVNGQARPSRLPFAEMKLHGQSDDSCIFIFIKNSNSMC
jgi:hypothetical protein